MTVDIYVNMVNENMNVQNVKVVLYVFITNVKIIARSVVEKEYVNMVKGDIFVKIAMVTKFVYIRNIEIIARSAMVVKSVHTVDVNIIAKIVKVMGYANIIIADLDVNIVGEIYLWK